MLKLILIIFLLSSSLFSHAEDSWVIEDIRVTGLQRVSAGSVFAVMPIGLGDLVSKDRFKEITLSIFETEKFDDVKLGRDGNALLIDLTERPTIDEIFIEGNKQIKTEALLDGLKKSGIFEGALYKRSVFESLSVELERQYASQGKYSSSVEVKTDDLPKNRIKLSVLIEEGNSASLRKINILGNTFFSEEELLDEFKLKEKSWLSVFQRGSGYSRENLKGDLETLESMYKNNGFLKFEVTNTMVSISEDKKDIYISILVNEGDVYKVNEVKLAGDLQDKEVFVRSLINIPVNEIYIEGFLKSTEDRITNLLENLGYMNAEVSTSKVLDEKEKTVSLTLFVDPGQRAMVNRISFEGNERTHDIVLRREMRQMEKSWISNNLLDNSKLRLDRLGFF